MEIYNKTKYLIFIAEGGIGKNISATAVVRAIKKQYPDKKIIVMAGCPEIFMYNPNVYKSFNFANPLYFYDDYINDETQIIKVEPYLNYGYINKSKHLVDAWCEEIGIQSNGIEPDIFFLDTELESANIYVDKLQTEAKKELILLQWIGGKIPKDKTKEELKSSLATMFRRSIPFEEVNKLVDVLKEKYLIGNVAHTNFPEIKNTTNIFFPIRSTIALLIYSKTFIGIDSFLQHAAASNQISKKGMVCWGGTTPTTLGYKSHINLIKNVCSTPFCHRPNSYLFDYQPQGIIWSCPNNERCLKYTSEEILNEFENNFTPTPIEERLKEETSSTNSCQHNCVKE